jgi:hypothetical protein
MYIFTGCRKLFLQFPSKFEPTLYLHKQLYVHTFSWKKNPWSYFPSKMVCVEIMSTLANPCHFVSVLSNFNCKWAAFCGIHANDNLCMYAWNFKYFPIFFLVNISYCNITSLCDKTAVFNWMCHQYWIIFQILIHEIYRSVSRIWVTISH